MGELAELAPRCPAPSPIRMTNRANGVARSTTAVPGTAVPGTARPGTVRRSAGPVSVTVLASDPITAEGTAACLRGLPAITLLPVDCAHRADVILILATSVTEETLSCMQRAAEMVAGRQVRFVLVGDGVREPQLLRAVSCGLVSFIPRQEADHKRIAAAIVAITQGRLDLPDVAVGWVVGQIRAIQQNVLAPNGLTVAGLAAREVDVLRLVADGLDTCQIAKCLNYSERTVKSIIHGALTRLNLRNRPHAIAYALRNGLL